MQSLTFSLVPVVLVEIYGFNIGYALVVTHVFWPE